jgi:phenylalanyl-tRNA synthetase alpha chain
MQIGDELPKNLDDLDSAQLQKAITLLADQVEKETGKASSTEQQKELLSQLFESDRGLFWRLYSRVLAKTGRVTWADYGIRQFLRAPALRFLQLGKLEEDPKDYFDCLRLYMETLIRNTTDVEKFTLARALWESRSEGIKSAISDYWLKDAKPELKPTIGRSYNELAKYIEDVLKQRYTAIVSGADEGASARVDLSLPGVLRPIGSHHLIRQVFQQIEDIFFSIGFSVVEGPEIETPYYNFEALNIPEFHPVRDDMDTFYLDLPKGAPQPLLLRTHTSPMQIRTMEKRQPPVRVIVPGKVYRRDNPDATHSFIFHQVEGLAVDTDITFCDFTGTIEYFVKQFFGPGVKTRFRPSYFPFTEPSVEFDVSCIFCGGSGSAAGGGTCSKCKGSGWIELFGAGMVDPAVYGFVKYDPKKVSGFAFGMGIDRLAMLKYGIDDIQIFFQNDVRFLRQFP